tara:strand:- start:895 stop:1389 length:495 start_codon:yes stop_codon:yes gene_type:complete
MPRRILGMKKQNKRQSSVQVRNCHEAAKVHPEFDAVISVVSHARDAAFAHPNHHREYFDDISDPIDWGREPRREQVQRIVEFVRTQPENSRFLVHCQAGISRSTATALGVLATLGWREKEAIEYLVANHPENRPFWPNGWVLSHFDALLGTRLVEFVEEHVILF